MSYLLITEGGEDIYRAETIGDDEKNAADSGYLEIINIDTMETYYNGEWSELPVWGF